MCVESGRGVCGNGFCPSCAAKRAAVFGAQLRDEILEEVGHAQWVFTIPKLLRPYFLHHRKLVPGRETGVGIATPEVVKLLPLSHQIPLAVADPGSSITLQDASGESVREINLASPSNPILNTPSIAILNSWAEWATGLVEMKLILQRS